MTRLGISTGALAWQPSRTSRGSCSIARHPATVCGVFGLCHRPVALISHFPSYMWLFAGVSIKYGGGSTCNSLPGFPVASTTIEVACDQSAGASTGVTFKVESCGLVVSMRSAYGCPSEYTTGLSGGWVFVLLLLVSGGVYVLGGVAYKKATLGTSGVLPRACTVLGMHSLTCGAFVCRGMPQAWKVSRTSISGGSFSSTSALGAHGPWRWSAASSGRHLALMVRSRACLTVFACVLHLRSCLWCVVCRLSATRL